MSRPRTSTIVLSGLNSRLVPNKLSKLGYAYRAWEWYSKTGK